MQPEFSVLYFLFDNWILLTIFVGTYLILRLLVHMDRRMIFLMQLSLSMLVLLAVADYVEAWLATLPERTVWRVLMSAMGYSLRPAIVLVLIAMLLNRQKLVVLIPAILNTLLCFASLFYPLVFGFTEDNEWFRGPLGAAPFVAGFFYLALLLVQTSRYLKRGQREFVPIYLYIMIISIATLGVAIGFNRHEIFNATYAVEILLYLLFLYVQLTKRDPLTKLLNRQSYYHEIRDRGDSITAVVSIDMNELKWVNDHEGHQAGDTALQTISGCFVKCASERESVYRVGGDEFFILSRGESRERLQELEKKLREELAKTGYCCSIGCAFRVPGEDAETLCRRADEAMYRDKAAYYTDEGHDRRRH